MKLQGIKVVLLLVDIVGWKAVDKLAFKLMKCLD